MALPCIRSCHPHYQISGMNRYFPVIRERMDRSESQSSYIEQVVKTISVDKRVKL